MGELPDADVEHTAPHDEERAPESIPAEHHSHCFQKVIVFAFEILFWEKRCLQRKVFRNGRHCK
jgi:hypothetical protein